MIEKSVEEQLKQLDKEFVKVALFEFPGVIMVGLGVYSKFGAMGDAFHPLLNNPSVVNGLLVVGGIIMLWGVKKDVDIAIKNKKLFDSSGPQ